MFFIIIRLGESPLRMDVRQSNPVAAVKLIIEGIANLIYTHPNLLIVRPDIGTRQ
jgi:hypothetical protein